MIYLSLFLSFLKIGIFSFGGAYGAIPLIQDVLLENGWADEAMFANLVALSEATPGPIMVNMATYIGNKQAGILGAAIATLGVILPAFVILLTVITLFKSLLKKKSVQAVLEGIKPCLMGIILATGVFMAIGACLLNDGMFSVDLIAWGILLILVAISVIFKTVRKKDSPPIWLILLAAVCGAVLY